MKTTVPYHRPIRHLSADEEAQCLDEIADCECPEHRPDLHDDHAASPVAVDASEAA